MQITINPNGHLVAGEPDRTVLESALAADLVIPYGCRNGACGTCKGKLVAGRVDYGHHQASTLTEEDKAKGLALFCVARPLTDITIEVREVRRAGDIQIKRLPCRIETIDKPAPDVAIVTLKLPANEKLRFLAGQYIDLLLKDGKRRSFSIATAPFVEGTLSLHVRYVKGGLFTEQLFHQYKGREILRFEGPLGTFFLRESDKPIVLVAGGTGFAPIKSLIEQAFHDGITRPMTLYWGVRSLADLYLPDLPGEWQKNHPDFRFIPVLSDPLPADGWTGRTGFVHRAVMEDFPDLSGYQVYTCGGPAMIDAARAEFTGQCSLPEGEFFADSFTYAADAVAPPA